MKMERGNHAEDKKLCKVKSVAEAYELNQKKSACVLGGMVWLKMQNRPVATAIDLSVLALTRSRKMRRSLSLAA